MSAYDAIIVGGGPAGSTLTWQMVKMGLKPLIIDRAHFPHVKRCAVPLALTSGSRIFDGFFLHHETERGGQRVLSLPEPDNHSEENISARSKSFHTV